MKIQVFNKIIVIWLVPMPIEMSKSFPWTIIMQILMVKLQNLNTGKKIGFLIVLMVPENEEKIMTLFNFQVLQTEAILGLEINSLSWYRGCFDIL